MGRTYELACHDCRRVLWIGQRHAGAPMERAYLYTTDAALKNLRDFLFGHLNHRLEFGDSELMSLLAYDNAEVDAQEN